MAKKKSKKKLFITLAVFGVVIIAIIGFAMASRGSKTVEVQTAKIERRTITQTVTAVGKIAAETKVTVASETSGEIVELPIKEGDTVRSGQLLARIKPDIIESQLEQSQAATESSQKEIDVRRSIRDKAKLEFDRTKDLYDKKFASKSEYDVAKAALDQAESSLAASQSGYKQSKAQLKQTQRNAARTVLHSPMDGVVTKLNVEKGDKVVGTNMMAGTEMMVVSDLGVMNAEVEVDENDIVLVKIGDTTKVFVDAIPDQTINGVVLEIGHSAITSSTGTQDQTVNFKVKIRITDSESKLRPGMSCNVEIQTKKAENVLSAPLIAVTTRDGKESDKGPGVGGPAGGAPPQGGEAPKGDNPGETKDAKAERNEELKKKREKVTSAVFVLEGNTVRLTTVKTGISDKGYIEILEGLKEGDEIVSGSHLAINKQLKDGYTVKVNQMGNTQFMKK